MLLVLSGIDSQTTICVVSIESGIWQAMDARVVSRDSLC